MTTGVAKLGTTHGPELLVELRGGRRRAQLEERLRELIRDGTLPAGARLPSSRALAIDLGVSRRLVVEAYSQLLAEGYLTGRRGAGTYVAAAAGAIEALPPPPAAPLLRFDFFPGSPDLGAFPRSAWLRAMREVMLSAPPSAFAYPDARGTPDLRTALVGYLRRVRGVVADPGSIVICNGTTHALALLARTLARRGIESICVEDPGLPPHRAVLAHAGLGIRGVPVDGEGVVVAALDAPAVLLTPAHQFPTGVALSARRRSELIEWARAGGLVIEDDYDAEFRYDRAPLGALQGLAPDRVIHLGTVSKTLGPALRLGWIVAPPWLIQDLAAEKLFDDFGSAALPQMALARLISSAAYDRQLRRARRANRARRDALRSAVARELPGARVEGIAAGLHLLVRLRAPVDAQRVMAAAAERSVGIYPLSFHHIEPPSQTDALVLGYAALAESAIRDGIRRLTDALHECEGL